MAKATFVIVGAGVAAATAAATLRSSGFDGRLVMVGQEADPPYNRPTLSKERLRNEIGDAKALFHPLDYYRSKEIELLLDQRVRHLNVAEHSIQLANGDTLGYDNVLVTTGAHLRRLNAPGEQLPGVYYLRSLADARVLSQVLAQRPRVVVTGTGFIGCEVAASARTVGCDVTLVGNTPPLAHALGSEIGALYVQYHRAQGVDVRTGTFVASFEGSGRLERAVLQDGSRVDCDVAVIGIGVEPSFEILTNTPVEVGGGVLVNEFCQTSVPRVFAAGDVASSWNPRYAKRLRVEHFDNAQHQAIVAAKAMLGPTNPYDPIPSFWSDQFSYSLRYRGDAHQWDSVAFRGDTQAGSFSAFYVKGGAVQAVCSVNRYAENYGAQRLIGKHVEPRLLEDDNVNVKEIDV
ncbi:MAG TPA: FAD-dependent oxidoreductase [Candidatus Binatia bacterium]|nr:FAD-dependent oxidoreductase [Candidatus Binatia bacterium]